MKIFTEIDSRLVAVLNRLNEIEEKIELKEEKLEIQISELEKSLEIKFKQYEDKLNELLLVQQSNREDDLSYQKQIMSFNKRAEIEGIDVHERLVHIEDKINLMLGDKDVENTLEKKDDVSVHSEKTIHFVRNIDWKNTGDTSTDPLLYFEFLAQKNICIHHTMREIRWNLIKRDDWIILGGGGIFECLDEFQEVINKLLSLSVHVISWGCGYNTHYDRMMNVKIDYSNFFRCTIRDYIVDKDEYMPDVSCMMDLFDKHYDIKREIGILEHYEFPILEFEYEKLTNTYAVNSIIRFIGESKVVITNTWHGCYWALLMGKKVIVYHPFSNKFENYKYKPTFYSGDLQKDIELAKPYENVLEECRNLNIKFAAEVFEEIDSNN